MQKNIQNSVFRSLRVCIVEGMQVGKQKMKTYSPSFFFNLELLTTYYYYYLLITYYYYYYYYCIEWQPSSNQVATIWQPSIARRGKSW